MASTADYQAIFDKKFSPRDEYERVYMSMLLDISARIEALETVVGRDHLQLKHVIRAVRLLAQGGEEQPEAESDEVAGEDGSPSSASSGAAGAAGGGATSSGPPPNKTPFPAGVPTSAPPGTKAEAAKAETVPPAATVSDVVPTSPAIPVPDTNSSRTMNAAPIPTPPVAKKPHKNGGGKEVIQ